MIGPITIKLPGAPQGKGRPRFRVVRTNAGAVFGNAYTPAKTRDYENDLKAAAIKAMRGRAPIEGPLSISIVAMMPIPTSWSKRKQSDAATGLIRPTTKPDWENIAKTTDALNKVVWKDDSQIVDGRVTKIYSAVPALIIDVQKLGPLES